MGDQLFLRTVHFSLQTAQPSIQIMLSKGVSDRIIVFKSILHILFSRSILLLHKPDVPKR